MGVLRGVNNMKIKTEIRKQTDTCEIRISAECDSPDEFKQVLDSCRGYMPRQKVLGIF
jgi:hypothetical protein